MSSTLRRFASPVRLSTSACRSTRRCSRAFSSATTTWSASEAAVSTCSASNELEARTSCPKSDEPIRSGKAIRSMPASGSPARASSPCGPSTTPPVAPVDSTADSTTTRTSWPGSCVAISASPNRVVASRMRLRSVSSSASRCSSCAAIRLNAVPSSANSSRPRTSTRSPKRPWAIALAAADEPAERADDRSAEQVRDDAEDQQRREQGGEEPSLRRAAGGVDRALSLEHGEDEPLRPRERRGLQTAVVGAVDPDASGVARLERRAGRRCRRPRRSVRSGRRRERSTARARGERRARAACRSERARHRAEHAPVVDDRDGAGSAGRRDRTRRRDERRRTSRSACVRRDGAAPAAAPDRPRAAGPRWSRASSRAA